MSDKARNRFFVWIPVLTLVLVMVSNVLGWSRSSGADSVRLGAVEVQSNDTAEKLYDLDHTLMEFKTDMSSDMSRVDANVEWLVGRAGGTPAKGN